MSNYSTKELLRSLKLQQGQALLIVILVMVITLTIGLSVALRTTTNLRTSTENENSERAFSAAEAGIEQALISNTSVPLTSLSNNTSYQTTVTAISGSGFNLNNDTKIQKDEPVDIWLSTYPNYVSPWSGSLSISWGSSTDVCSSTEASNTQAAVEVVLISGTTANPKTTSYLLDPCSARAGSNNFEHITTAGDVIGGRTYARKKTITVTSGLIARVIPLYASTFIGVQKGGADANLPTQGTIVTSVGVSDNTQRKIISFRGYPKLPVELFPFILFSPK